MKRFIFALILLVFGCAEAAAQTSAQFGISPGYGLGNPQTLCVYDLSNSRQCLSLGTIDSVAHTFTPVGTGTNAPAGTAGQIQFNNAGSMGGFTMGGDCTASVPNVTCTKTNGVSFSALATTVPGTGVSAALAAASESRAAGRPVEVEEKA